MNLYILHWIETHVKGRLLLFPTEPQPQASSDKNPDQQMTWLNICQEFIKLLEGMNTTTVVDSLDLSEEKRLVQFLVSYHNESKMKIASHFFRNLIKECQTKEEKIEILVNALVWKHDGPEQLNESCGDKITRQMCEKENTQGKLH